jgi:hypothetical protein
MALIVERKFYNVKMKDKLAFALAFIRGLVLRAVAMWRAWAMFESRKNSKPASPSQ